MLRFLLLVVVLFAIALGFHALSDTSGELALTIGDTVYAVDLTTAVIAVALIVLVAIGVIWFAGELLTAPWRIARRFRRRNVERIRAAQSQGLVAIAAGDVRAAERATLEAAKRAPAEPLTLLLRAQTAQLKGDRDGARGIFQAMTEDSATRVAGLRGLYVEAEREGELEAAHLIAAQAREEAPAAPWAARALMRHQTAAHDWDGALATLTGASDGRILDKRTARRQRAVILTAKALDKEMGEPDVARAAALEAHDLANDFVPAAVVAGRLVARQGDIKRASRILETTWKLSPHPEIADAYMHVRSGDAAADRLKRAEALLRMRAHADEARHAVARAAIDARDFDRARAMLEPVVEKRPTRTAFILMAELAQAETGDRGRAREWLARAIGAPRDPAWTADGVVLEDWAPVSPVTGKLDAVEWKVPIAELEGPKLELGPETPQETPLAPTITITQEPAPAKAPPKPPPPDGVADARERAAHPAKEAESRSAAVTPAPTASAPVAAEKKPEPKAAEARPRETGPVEMKKPGPEVELTAVGVPPSPDDPGVNNEPDDDQRSLPGFLRGG